MTKNTKLNEVSKAELQRALKQHPGHVEYNDKIANVIIYRLKDKRVIGMELHDDSHGTIYKLSEAFA